MTLRQLGADRRCVTLEFERSQEFGIRAGRFGLAESSGLAPERGVVHHGACRGLRQLRRVELRGTRVLSPARSLISCADEPSSM